jgi:hypothetical protein
MAVDGGLGLGVDPQVEGLESRREGVPVGLGELREVRNARRERTSRPVQGTLLKSCTGPSGSRSRRRSFAAALRPLPVSRRPFGSGPGFPVTPPGRRSPVVRARRAECGR